MALHTVAKNEGRTEKDNFFSSLVEHHRSSKVILLRASSERAECCKIRSFIQIPTFVHLFLFSRLSFSLM